MADAPFVARGARGLLLVTLLVERRLTPDDLEIRVPLTHGEGLPVVDDAPRVTRWRRRARAAVREIIGAHQRGDDDRGEMLADTRA